MNTFTPGDTVTFTGNYHSNKYKNMAKGFIICLLLTILYSFVSQVDTTSKITVIDIPEQEYIMLDTSIATLPPVQKNLKRNKRKSFSTEETKIIYDLGDTPMDKTFKDNFKKRPITDKLKKDFEDKWGPVAQAHQRSYGIPASIKMAQAIVESRWGTSFLAARTNNFFGIKCFKNHNHKQHGCFNYHDDEPDDLFRNYKTIGQSWADHSQFITKCGKRQKACYGWMTKKYPVGSKNYIKNWCNGLKESGYFTSNTAKHTLMRVVKNNNLTKLDQL